MKFMESVILLDEVGWFKYWPLNLFLCDYHPDVEWQFDWFDLWLAGKEDELFNGFSRGSFLFIKLGLAGRGRPKVLLVHVASLFLSDRG